MQHKSWSEKTEEVLYYVSSNEELDRLYKSLVDSHQTDLNDYYKRVEVWQDAGRDPKTRPTPNRSHIRSTLRPKRKAIIEYWKQYGMSGPPYKRVTILKEPSYPSGTDRRLALLTGRMVIGHEILEGKLVPIKSGGS